VLLASYKDSVYISSSASTLYSKKCTSLHPYILSPSSTVSRVPLGSK